MSWVYIRSEPQLFTVGYFDPNGNWYADSDHPTQEAAGNRVHYLNGGNPRTAKKQDAAQEGRWTRDSHTPS